VFSLFSTDTEILNAKKELSQFVLFCMYGLFPVIVVGIFFSWNSLLPLSVEILFFIFQIGVVLSIVKSHRDALVQFGLLSHSESK